MAGWAQRVTADPDARPVESARDEEGDPSANPHWCTTRGAGKRLRGGGGIASLLVGERKLHGGVLPTEALLHPLPNQRGIADPPTLRNCPQSSSQVLVDPDGDLGSKRRPNSSRWCRIGLPRGWIVKVRFDLLDLSFAVAPSLLAHQPIMGPFAPVRPGSSRSAPVRAGAPGFAPNCSPDRETMNGP